MTLRELLAIASHAYYDNLILKYADDPTGNHGDGLAAFIATEIGETYEKERPDSWQIDIAIEALQSAQRELQLVIDALQATPRNN